MQALQRPQYACEIWLEGGSYLRAGVVQDGIDVSTHLRGPDGHLLLKIDYRTSPNGSHEPLHFVADEPGRYRIDVVANPQLKPSQPSPAYRFELTLVRPADEMDRKRALATAEFSLGRLLAKSVDDPEALKEAEKHLQTAAEKEQDESLQPIFKLAISQLERQLDEDDDDWE